MEKIVDGIGHGTQRTGQHVDDEANSTPQRLAESFKKPSTCMQNILWEG